MKIVLSKLLPFLIVSSLFLLGLFLRLYRIDQLAQWGDSGRDILIAQHIVEYKQNAFIVPFAAGGFGILNNSSVYYWLVASMWRIFPTYFGMLILWAVISSFCVISQYFLGRLLVNKYVGYLTALFTAISCTLILPSKTIFQPNLLPLFASITCLACYMGWTRKSVLWLMVSMLIFFSGLSLHYAFLPLGVGLTFCWMLTIKELYEHDKTLFAVFLPISFFFLLFIMWILLTNKGPGIDLWKFIVDRVSAFLAHSSENRSFPILRVFEYLFPWTPRWVQWANGLFLIFGWGVILWWKRKNQHLRKPLLFLTCIISGFSLIFIYHGDVFDSYVLPFFPILIVMYAVVLGMLFKHWKVVSLVMIAIFIWSFQHGLRDYLTSMNKSEIQQTQEIVNLILSDYQKEFPEEAARFLNPSNSSFTQPSFTIAERSPDLSFFNWYDASYWFFIEQKVQRPLTFLVSEEKKPNNVMTNHEDKNVKIIYLICRSYPPRTDEVQRKCLELYTHEEKNPLTVDPKPLLLPQEGNLHAVWKLRKIP